MAIDALDVNHLALGVNAPGVHVNKAAVKRLLLACDALARDLRELHDRTGISLDNWASARQFVEAFTGPITENHA